MLAFSSFTPAPRTQHDEVQLTPVPRPCSAALSSDGTVYCWGAAAEGQTGAQGAPAGVPCAVLGPGAALAAVPGTAAEACACGPVLCGLLHAFSLTVGLAAAYSLKKMLRLSYLAYLSCYNYHVPMPPSAFCVAACICVAGRWRAAGGTHAH